MVWTRLLENSSHPPMKQAVWKPERGRMEEAGDGQTTGDEDQMSTRARGWGWLLGKNDGSARLLFPRTLPPRASRQKSHVTRDLLLPLLVSTTSMRSFMAS